MVAARVSRRGLVAGAALAALATACSTGDSRRAPAPRALSSEEAERLAMVRFRLFEQGQVPVEMTWPGSPPSTCLTTLDLREHLAYGSYRAEVAEDSFDEGHLVWDLQRLATARRDGATDEVAGPEEWSTREMSTEVGYDVFLALALNLGTDRPENPVLLQQSSARWLRDDEVDGAPVMVVEGPRAAAEEPSGSGRTRYWVEQDGALRRFQAFLGDARGRFATIDVLREPHPGATELAAMARRVLLRDPG